MQDRANFAHLPLGWLYFEPAGQQLLGMIHSPIIVPQLELESSPVGWKASGVTVGCHIVRIQISPPCGSDFVASGGI
jgi:hypothetical protein